MAFYFRSSNYSRLLSDSYKSPSCRKPFKTPLNCQRRIRVNYSKKSLQTTCASCICDVHDLCCSHPMICKVNVICDMAIHWITELSRWPWLEVRQSRLILSGSGVTLNDRLSWSQYTQTPRSDSLRMLQVLQITDNTRLRNRINSWKLRNRGLILR